MNAIFLTQSNSIDFFYDLFLELKKKDFVKEACFIVSDPYHYEEFKLNYPKFESDIKIIIKEWDLLLKAKIEGFDIKKLESFEKSLSEPNLWPSIISNRRIIFGSNYAFNQDYESRFTHEEILSVQTVFYSEIDKLFNEFDPNIVFSFICTTTQEYICDQFANERKIPHLNLRPTRVENFMHFAPTVHEPSSRLEDDYNESVSLTANDDLYDKAADYLERSKQDIVRYEGVFLPTQKPPQADIKLPKLTRIIKLTKRAYLQEKQYRFSIPKGGTVLPGFFIPLFHRMVLNPFKIRSLKKYLSKKYLPTNILQNIDYAFYPLHIEPEVTLLVYSRFYLNQIEVIRNIAYNLPAGMKLLVKEHPAAVGKRPLSYYHKILEIPNVEMIDSQLKTSEIIDHASLVSTISGSVGFEAVLKGKPVIIFGTAPYQILPDTMVKRIENINDLSSEIRILLDSFSYDQEKIKRFIASVMRTSIPIDFYTTLLGRSKQHKFSENSDYRTEIGKLADYSIKSYSKIKDSYKI